MKKSLISSLKGKNKFKYNKYKNKYKDKYEHAERSILKINRDLHRHFNHTERGKLYEPEI